GPLHPLCGLHAVHHISARLPGEYAMLPVIQNVAVANKHIHSPAMGPYMLADARPVSENDDVDATVKAFRTAVSRGVYNACDHYFLYLLERLSPMQILELLLEVGVPKNQLDDHYFLFPVFTWRALEYFGWEYAKYIGRAPVRYVTRPTAPAMMLDVDELIRKYELLERDLRAKTGDDETAAITAFADEIGRCNEFGEIPEMLARALGGGLSLEGAGEALSVGGSTLFLRSKTGNPMDVHINTGANTRRYLLRQPELSRRIKLQALLTWNTGPEVRMAQRMLASDVQPEAERVAALSAHTQDQLLEELESLISSLPVGERLPTAGLASWRSTDEVKHAADLARPHPGCVRPRGRGDAFLGRHAHPGPVRASHGESSCRIPGSDARARRATIRHARRSGAGHVRMRRDRGGRAAARPALAIARRNPCGGRARYGIGRDRRRAGRARRLLG